MALRTTREMTLPKQDDTDFQMSLAETRAAPELEK
jgi:hypothetical protein